MRDRIDFTPYRRSAIGFDRLFDVLEGAARTNGNPTDNYPPFDIERQGEDAYRITLTAPLINQAQAVAFLVYGADKAGAVQSVLHGARDIEQFPAQLIAPGSGELHWFLDEAAAKQLP